MGNVGSVVWSMHIIHTGFSDFTALLVAMAILLEISPKTLRCFTTSFLAAAFVDSLFSSCTREEGLTERIREDLAVGTGTLLVPLRIMAATLLCGCAWVVVRVVDGVQKFKTTFYIARPWKWQFEF